VQLESRSGALRIIIPRSDCTEFGVEAWLQSRLLLGKDATKLRKRKI
jgi:hypothetical protein